MNKSKLESIRTTTFPEAYFGLYAFIACVVLLFLISEFPEDMAIWFRLCLSLIPIAAIDIGVVTLSKSQKTAKLVTVFALSGGIILNLGFLLFWTLL